MPHGWTQFLAVVISGSAAVAADTPVTTNLRDTAQVELQQIVTTVSPKSGDLSLCKELSRDSFEVWGHDDRIIPIYSVDREGALSSAPGAESVPTVKRGPVYIAFYLDLPSLGNYPYKNGSKYHKPSMADQAVRQMLASDAFRASFKPELGDKLLLALFNGDGVEFVTGLTGVEGFTKAFDAIEERTFHPPEHLDDRHRWSSIQQFGIALGQLGEIGTATKHVILLSADFPMSADTGERTISNIASVLQRAHVVIHPVDLIWNLRGLPFGILTLSWIAQGELFGNGKTALDAVEKVIGIYDNGCRLIISIRAQPDKVSLHLLDKRFTIPPAAPVRSLPPLTIDERYEANINLPRWGKGLQLDSMFWPVKPIDRNSWRGFIVANLEIAPDEKLADDIATLVVLAKVTYGAPPVELRLGSTDVDELRRRGSKILIFEVTVNAGSRSILTVASTENASIGATSRRSFTVPRPPKAGESASWSLIGGEQFVAGTSILIPAFDTTLAEGHPAAFMGYACGTAQATAGVVYGATGETVATVALTLQQSTTGNCGWLMGSAPATLPPGQYTFRPPSSRDADGVRFAVAAARICDP